MPHSSVGDPFPVAGASRRRRLLLSHAAAVSAAAAAERDEAIAAAAPDLRAIRLLPADEVPGFGTIGRLLGGAEPLTWVFTGDCLTGGTPQPDRGRSDSEHFAERVRWELRRLQDVVIPTGVPGDRVRELLPQLDWRVLRFRPDVVSLMLGVGEILGRGPALEEFPRQLTDVVRRVRSDGAILVLHTPHRIPQALDRSHAELRSVVRIIRETARQWSLPCVDHWAWWKEAHPDDTSLCDWLDADGLLPNARGHRELAKLLFRKLGIYDEHSPTCAAKLP